MSIEYIRWLYFENPLGTVVGFDAIEEGKLASHYACIPTSIDGLIGLLSVNTATHPRHRSKGLYKKLASMTYETWSMDYHFVVGVANENSANTFVNQLGFKELGKLNLRFGNLARPFAGSKKWTHDELEWRIKSPRQKFCKSEMSESLVKLSTRPNSIPLKITSIVQVSSSKSQEAPETEESNYGFTVDWIRDSNPGIRLPEFLKPSPLILIHQPLSSKSSEVNSWSFSDFDIF